MSAAAAAAADRDWAELPTEMLGSIAKHLTVEDYIRFGAVCTSWASALSPRDELFLPRAPQMPWLLLPGDDGDGSWSIVTLPDRRRRRFVSVPEMRGKWCAGSQDGWLVLFDDRSEVSLLNPLTRAQIHLPSVATIPGVKPVYNSDGSISEFLYTVRLDWELEPYTPHLFRCISFKKIVLSSRPTAGSSFTAMAIFSIISKPAFATAGGGKWTVLREVRSITDVIYHDDKFLAVSIEGELYALDVIGPSPPQTKMLTKGWGSMCTGTEKYLVDSSGDLLLVWRDINVINDEQGGYVFTTSAIKIMKFDPQRASWEPLKSLGDRSLFLGLCRSISLSAREIPDLKRNCFYFTEITWDWNPDDGEEEKLRMRDVGVFNLEDGTFDRYSPPDPRLNWPPPLWFTVTSCLL